MRPLSSRQTCECCCSDAYEVEFKKIVELKDVGVTIYQYLRQFKDEIQSNIETGEVFILQNTGGDNHKIEDILVESEKTKIRCPRCAKMIQRVKSLFKNLPPVNVQEVTGVCDHCYQKELLRCACCEQIVDKFLKFRKEEATLTKENRQRNEEWLLKTQLLMKQSTSKLKDSKPELYRRSEGQIQQTQIPASTNIPITKSALEYTFNSDSDARQRPIVESGNISIYQPIEQIGKHLKMSNVIDSKLGPRPGDRVQKSQVKSVQAAVSFRDISEKQNTRRINDQMNAYRKYQQTEEDIEKSFRVLSFLDFPERKGSVEEEVKLKQKKVKGGILKSRDFSLADDLVIPVVKQKRPGSNTRLNSFETAMKSLSEPNISDFRYTFPHDKIAVKEQIKGQMSSSELIKYTQNMIQEQIQAEKKKQRELEKLNIEKKKLDHKERQMRAEKLLEDEQLSKYNDTRKAGEEEKQPKHYEADGAEVEHMPNQFKEVKKSAIFKGQAEKQEKNPIEQADFTAAKSGLRKTEHPQELPEKENLRKRKDTDFESGGKQTTDAEKDSEEQLATERKTKQRDAQEQLTTERNIKKKPYSEHGLKTVNLNEKLERKNRDQEENRHELGAKSSLKGQFAEQSKEKKQHEEDTTLNEQKAKEAKKALEKQITIESKRHLPTAASKTVQSDNKDDKGKYEQPSKENEEKVGTHSEMAALLKEQMALKNQQELEKEKNRKQQEKEREEAEKRLKELDAKNEPKQILIKPPILMPEVEVSDSSSSDSFESMPKPETKNFLIKGLKIYPIKETKIAEERHPNSAEKQYPRQKTTEQRPDRSKLKHDNKQNTEKQETALRKSGQHGEKPKSEFITSYSEPLFKLQDQMNKQKAAETTLNIQLKLPETTLNVQQKGPETILNSKHKPPGTTVNTQLKPPGTTLNDQQKVPETALKNKLNPPGTTAKTQNKAETLLNTQQQPTGPTLNAQQKAAETTLNSKLEPPETTVNTQHKAEASLNPQLKPPRTTVNAQQKAPETTLNSKLEQPGTTVKTQYKAETSLNTQLKTTGTTLTVQQKTPETTNSKLKPPETTVNTQHKAEASLNTQLKPPGRTLNDQRKVPGTSLIAQQKAPETSLNTQLKPPGTTVNTQQKSETSLNIQKKPPETTLNSLQKAPEATPKHILENKSKSAMPDLPDSNKGIIRYTLSDRSFIEKGWTMLPTEKVVRKMNVYRMRPAKPEFDWFEHNKYKREMAYDSGEKLAEFDENGRGRWYYKSGELALDYYDAEETNAGQRFVVYSTVLPDERGRSRPKTVLATFDYSGNGIVFDHAGKIRLKYNQTEGVVLDRTIGPVSHWKWHTLNDPPVLQQVMIDTQMPYKDPTILKMGDKNADLKRPDNEDMIAIEFENFLKEKRQKLTQSFKPFQIKMKAMKINEFFSLRVMDQASVYLLYRDGSTNLKINIGMVLDHKEIVDTDTAEIGEVSNTLDKLPACTDSVAGLQEAVSRAQAAERSRVRHERRVKRPEATPSVDALHAASSRPLRTPVVQASLSSCDKMTRRRFKPSCCDLYYSTQLY